MEEKKKRVRPQKKTEGDTKEGKLSKPKKVKKPKAKKAGRTPRPTDSSVIYRTGEMPKMRGGGVAMRLALAISATVFVIMAVVAIVMIVVVSNAVDAQIDADGIAAATLLAAADVESWKGYYGVDELIQDHEEQVARIEFNRKRLSRILSEDSQILNAQIIISDKSGGFVTRRDAQGDLLSADRREAPQFKQKPSGKLYEVGEVMVIYGFMTIENRYYDCRQFQAPIKDYKGELTGYASVVISEDQISKQKWALAGTIAILFLVFIGLGVGIAFFLGRKITRPVKALIDDVTAVAGGDLTHHTVPRSGDEIGLLARTFDKMTKNLNEAQAKEMELAGQRHQLAVAQEVQKNLLPKEIIEVAGYEIIAFHRSARREVHGSYYDVIPYPDGKVGVLVAAASGKGIPAAMVMTMARSFFRSLGEKVEEPAAIMRETNRLLSPDLRAGMYVEVLMVLLDPKNNKAKQVSAGPGSLLRYNFSEKKLQGIHADGIALGFDKGPVFDKALKEVEYDVAPGDRLVLAAPGVFNIKNPEGAELGTRGFAVAVNKNAALDSQAFVDRVVAMLDSFAGHEIQDTDVTFVTVRRKA